VQVTVNVSFAYLRHAMMKIAYELASTDRLAGYVGEAQPCTVFNFWIPHEAHHLAYAAALVVSRNPGRYIRTAADSSKLRFLAIDSVSGKTINTTYDAESRRIATAMTAYQRLPPFPDPL
jgi:hypothetical protein